MLPARHRLTERADFAATIRGRASTRRGCRLLVVHTRPADPSRTDTRSGNPSRVGLVVSKAVGNAVTRTRVKRRLRAQMAPLVDRIPAGTDVVIRANPAAATATSDEIGEGLRHCLRHLLVKEST